MEYIFLNNGIKIPKIGFGTLNMLSNNNGEQIIIEAINLGYRLLDTASIYGNEDVVGRAIKKCNVSREELFITGKMWFDHNSYDKAKEAFYDSLENLQLDYIDLYLIHYPFNDYMGAWRALEELYEEGKIKAIGVSNFFNDQLLNLISFNRIKPVVNQIQCSPFLQRDIEKSFLEKRDIAIQAWQSFAQGKNDIFNNPVLVKIGKKYDKSVAQVILRWQVQTGICVIPSATNIERMKQNLEIFDFNLDDDDINMIRLLNENEELGKDDYRLHMLEKFL